MRRREVGGARGVWAPAPEQWPPRSRSAKAERQDGGRIARNAKAPSPEIPARAPFAFASEDCKPDLAGTADPAFRGEADRHNPEDLFLASIAACHMLFYLSLCAKGGVRVTAYEDDTRGTMALHPGGGGRFEEVTLRPVVTVADAETVDAATRLHEKAHDLCFIANSCSVPINVEPVVRVG